MLCTCSIHEDTPGQAHEKCKPNKYGSIHILERDISYPLKNHYPLLAANDIVFKIWNDSGFMIESGAKINNSVVWCLFDSVPAGEYSMTVLYKGKESSVHMNAIVVSENKTSQVPCEWIPYLQWFVNKEDTVTIKWYGKQTEPDKTFDYSGMFVVRDYYVPDEVYHGIYEKNAPKTLQVEPFKTQITYHEQLSCSNGKNTYRSAIDSNSGFHFKMPSGYYYCYLDEIHNGNIVVKTMEKGKNDHVIFFPARDSVMQLMFYNEDLYYHNPIFNNLR